MCLPSTQAVRLPSDKVLLMGGTFHDSSGTQNLNDVWISTSPECSAFEEVVSTAHTTPTAHALAAPRELWGGRSDFQAVAVPDSELTGGAQVGVGCWPLPPALPTANSRSDCTALLCTCARRHRCGIPAAFLNGTLS